MGRRKKSNSEPSSPAQSEFYVNLEIDAHALRGKNRELVQNVAKLQQDKAHLQKQIVQLQEDNFRIHTRYLNLKNVIGPIDSTVKLCLPRMAEVVKYLTKIMQLSSVGAAISGFNKDPKTQTVKPHIVNGTVISNPTITLSRFNDIELDGSPRNRSGNSPGNSPMANNRPLFSSPPRRRSSQNYVPDTRPSTSRGFGENPSANYINKQRNADSVENEEDEPVIRYSRRKSERRQIPREEFVQEQNFLDCDPMDLQLEEDDTDEEHDEGQDYCSRLVTIEEGDDEYDGIMNSSATFTNLLREIRIYLNPLPAEHLKRISDMQCTGRSSSLSGEPSNSILDVNNTILNDTHGSPNRTVRFMDSTIDFSLKSPAQSRPDGFSTKDTDWSKVQVRMRSSELSRPSCSFTDDISAIRHLHSRHDIDDNVNGTNDSNDAGSSKIFAMRSLGLSPNNQPYLTTSTPLVRSARSSSRLSRKQFKSPDITIKPSPIVSNVTKRKVSGENKFAKVIIQRLSLDKTGSPVEQISKVVDTTVITSGSDRKLGKRNKDNGMDNDEFSETSASDSDESHKTKGPVKRKRKVTFKKKGKENRKQIVSLIQLKSSPRPKRAARPTALQEKSLKKKMRRSR